MCVCVCVHSVRYLCGVIGELYLKFSLKLAIWFCLIIHGSAYQVTSRFFWFRVADAHFKIL